jgi:hypothetical protein
MGEINMSKLIAATVDIRGNLPSVPGSANVQTDLGIIVGSFVGTAIVLAALAALFFMVVGGVKWVTAGGDKGKIEKAQSAITQSIIGLAITASIYALFQVVQYFFGISIIG